MKKLIFSIFIGSLAVAFVASVASASYLGDFLRAGINPTSDPILFNYTGIMFEGETVDGNETTFLITDPSSNVIITIPDSNQTIGTATTIQDDLILSADFADEDWGDLSVSSNSVTFDNDTIDAAHLADGDWGDLSISANSATFDNDTINTTHLADADWGDFSISSGSATLDAGVVAAAEMADTDHGDVSWSSGVASVEAMDDDPSLDGSFSFNSANVTDAGPTDDLDVSGINVVYLDTTSNNVTIGSFTGGAAGQILFISVTDATNNATLEHNEATGNQDIFLSSGADETLTTSYGGWTLVFDGTGWREIENNQ